MSVFRIWFLSFCMLVAGCASAPFQSMPPPAPALEPAPSPLPPVGYAPPSSPDASLPAAPTAQDRDYKLLFGTSRKPLAVGNDYTEERDDKVHYGQVTVRVPAGHMTGSIGTNGWFERDTRLAVSHIERFGNSQDFLHRARSLLRDVVGPENGYLLVFIHGYNNSFRDAAIRAAQLGVDLDVPDNNMLFFSWASKKSTPKYTVDEATIDASEVHFASFLKTVRSLAGERKVHVIAHSMGNRALLRVLANNTGIKFGQIILAAPDLDRDLFAQLAANYVDNADRTTVYLSPYDIAVRASNYVHDYPRIGCGDAPQVEMKGIENVVARLRDEFPAHAYFAESRPVLTDIKNLILKNQPARSGSEWIRHQDFWTVGSYKPWIEVACENTQTLRIN